MYHIESVFLFTPPAAFVVRLTARERHRTQCFDTSNYQNRVVEYQLHIEFRNRNQISEILSTLDSIPNIGIETIIETVDNIKISANRTSKSCTTNFIFRYVDISHRGRFLVRYLPLFIRNRITPPHTCMWQPERTCV